MILVAGMAVVHFGNFEARRLRQRAEQLEREKTQLVEYAQRLSASRRVAQVSVLKQEPDDSGRPKTTILWQEMSTQGTIARPQTLEVSGTLVYFEALVLKFSHHHVGEGDISRGTSLALFRRIFGDHQAPQSGPQLDQSNRPPDTEGKGNEELHARLWQRFWDFVENRQLADEYGVRIAQVEAPAVPLRVGQNWEVSLDAAGGLNIRKIGDSAPLASRHEKRP